MTTETVKLTTEERALISRMADLMEQGSVGKRQITGQYFEIDGNGVCAVGAMLEAVKVKPQSNDFINVKRSLGITEWPKVMYPSDVKYWKWIWDISKPVQIDDIIVSLNDYAGWTFDKIINWLRSLVVVPESEENA